MEQPGGYISQASDFLDGRGFNALLRENCIASSNQPRPIVRLVRPGFPLFRNCLVVHTNRITWKEIFVKRGVAYSESRSSSSSFASFFATCMITTFQCFIPNPILSKHHPDTHLCSQPVLLLLHGTRS